MAKKIDGKKSGNGKGSSKLIDPQVAIATQRARKANQQVKRRAVAAVQNVGLVLSHYEEEAAKREFFGAIVRRRTNEIYGKIRTELLGSDDRSYLAPMVTAMGTFKF